VFARASVTNEKKVLWNWHQNSLQVRNVGGGQPGTDFIKLFKTVIWSLSNKLVCFTLINISILVKLSQNLLMETAIKAPRLSA
jgi:hypothetical protein